MSTNKNTNYADCEVIRPKKTSSTKNNVETIIGKIGTIFLFSVFIVSFFGTLESTTKRQTESLRAEAGEVNVQAQTEVKNPELETAEKALEEAKAKVESLKVTAPWVDDKTEQDPKLSVENIAKIQSYINRYFPNTPLTAQQLAEAGAKNNIPVGFILAVGHNESHLGTKGRAVETKNPFNVGNVTAGDYLPTNCNLYSNCLDSWQSGLDNFTSLMVRCYFHENEEIKLQTWIDRDFKAVRCNIAGKRYMTDWGAKWKYQERINNLNELQINY